MALTSMIAGFGSGGLPRSSSLCRTRAVTMRFTGLEESNAHPALKTG